MAKEDEITRLLDELVKGKTPEEILGEGGVLKELTKRLVERVLEGEMTEHLGYEKHAAAGMGTGNSRNGKSSKKIRTDTGDLEIVVPRDREGEFEPQFVRKRQRRLPGFDDKVIALYARGMTTREIQSGLRELYGTEVSPTLISAVTDSVLEDVKAWQARPLESIYPIVYLDAIHLKIRRDRQVQTRAVYLALGINLEGKKDLLGIWVGENEGSKFWMNVLTELQNRGLKDVLIACVDGLKGFPEAISSLYPKTDIQLCIVHLVRHSLRYVSYKDRRAVAADLKVIYSAATVEAAETALAAFEEKWDSQYPSISKSWRSRWENIIPFFNYPKDIRKVIYTTNAIESINYSIRKVTKKRGAFPTDDSVRKVIYLAITKASERWTMPIRDWPRALNHFAIMFEGRVPV